MNTGTPGPEVDAVEDLYRCITTPDWWVEEEKRPSSAAFKQPDFSTDVVSIAKTPQYTLARFPVGCGLVMFNYGEAKEIGFLARLESDPQYPENAAHANVYNPTGAGKRKTMAQKLVTLIVATGGVVVTPAFTDERP